MDVDEEPRLYQLLSHHMTAKGFKDQELARKVNARFGSAFIHRSTIRNWRDGTSTKVRDWRQLVAVATVLGLDEREVNQMLVAAQQAPIRKLWLDASEADKRFLLPWTEQAPLRGIDSSLKNIQTDVSEILAVTTQGSFFTAPPNVSAVTVESWVYNADGGITSVGVSADGQIIVAATLEKAVVCVSNEGQLCWRKEVGNQAWRIGLSATGEIVVVGTGSTRFWDMSGRALFCFSSNGLLRWQVDLEASVWGLSVSADGSTVAVGTSSRELILFDHQGHHLWNWQVSGLGWYAWVWSTALSADGQIIVAGAADKRIRLLDRNGKLRTVQRARADVFAVAISADGTTIAAGDGAGYVYVLDNGGQLLWEEKLADNIWQVTLSNDGQRLLVGAGEKEAHLHVYDRGGRLLWRRYVGATVNALELSANGQRIVIGSADGDIYILDGAGNLLHKARAGKKVRDVGISAAGKTVVVGSEDGILHGFKLTAD